MIRLDFEESLGEVGGFDGEALASHYAQALNRCEVVVLSDYGKGTLRDVASLIRAARAQGRRVLVDPKGQDWQRRSEEHTSELQSLMRISYAVFCLKKKKQPTAK